MLGARLDNWHEMRTEVFGGTLLNSEFRSMLIIIESTIVEGSKTWVVYQAEALFVTLVLGRMRPFESDGLKHWRGQVTTVHARIYILIPR